jgi:hypothetical protein
VLNLSFSGGSYANGTDVAEIFSNTGSRSGDFTSVSSSGLAADQSVTFNPLTGRITIVPEPAMIPWTLAAGLAALLLTRSGSRTAGVSPPTSRPRWSDLLHSVERIAPPSGANRLTDQP